MGKSRLSDRAEVGEADLVHLDAGHAARRQRKERVRVMMRKLCIRPLMWVLIISLALPAGGFAQGDAEAPAVFRQEEMDQMLAPIALYPDSLLVQILMAATYPLEVVAAARWVNANPGLKDDPLAEAMEQKDWDPSVKSLVNFPSVLAMMNDRLDWMQKLGDAFLAQEEQVMSTVQSLREKAYAQGSLRTSGNQNVIVQEKEIIIEPASPDVIYVPVYDPYAVYGPWWYPAYPPYAFYPPGFIAGSNVLFFGTGVFFGVSWGYAWGGFDWHRRHTFIHVHQHDRFNRRIDRRRYADRFAVGPDGRGRWRHDPVHRKGVVYRDRITRERFGQGTRPGAGTRQEFRGRFPDGGARGSGGADRPAVVRPPRGVPGRDGAPPGGVRVLPGQQGPGSGRPAILAPGRPAVPPSGPAPRLERRAPERPTAAPQRPRSVFDRPERSGSEAGSSSQRGRESRQRMSVPRPSAPPGGGGVGRPGGGGRGGDAGSPRGRDGGGGDRGGMRR